MPEAIDRQQATELLRQMVTIRTFETTVEALFKAGELPGFVHSCAGQEAIAVGVCSQLTRTDYITSTHRGHGHAIAKGIALNSIFAELYGREAGACRGRGGSMHVADFSIGMLGANGIVGGGFGIAAGAALAIKHHQRPDVAVCFFGDGAANKGTFHEALNFAGVHTLPVVFVCENNRYAQFTAASRTTAVADISVRAASYGMAGESIDGNDLLAVIDAAGRAIERARRGDGATLINMNTYRHGGHYVGDAEQYRAREEVDAVRGNDDPIARFVQRIVADGVLTEADVDTVQSEVAASIDAAREFAVAAPLPDPADALRDVWTPAERPPGSRTAMGRAPQAPGGAAPEGKRMTFGQATLEAMQFAMDEDPDVVVVGEDISWGGNFGQFRGLIDRYGPERVIDMPISEALIVALSVGASVAGLKVVASMSFVEFTLGAMDEIVNQATKFRYMFGGQTSVPIVLRASDGIRGSSGAQHSSSLEGLFCNIPGLKVVAPSNGNDAKGLLRAAIADPDPVVYLEHKKITGQRAEVTDGDFIVPLGSAKVIREGSDVTVITYSNMVNIAVEAAHQLADNGVSVEVIDLRSLVPLDIDTISTSARKTGVVLAAHESWSFGGFGAEILAQIREALPDIDLRLHRLGAKSAPIPFSPTLEPAIVPGLAEVIAAIRGIASPSTSP